MLPLVCSISILGTIVHHNLVLLFSCFCNKVSFEPMFCKLHILVFDFPILYLDLKLPSLCHGWFVSFGIPCILTIFVFITQCWYSWIKKMSLMWNLMFTYSLNFLFEFCASIFWCTNYTLVNHVCNWMTQGHGYIILSNICENFL
jgi:hypothetical protein